MSSGGFEITTVPSGWSFTTHGRGIIDRCAGSLGHRLTVRKRVSCQSGDALAKLYIVRTRNIHRSCGGGSSIEHMHCYDRHGENNREGEMKRESNEKVEILHLLDSNHQVQISCGIDKGNG